VKEDKLTGRTAEFKFAIEAMFTEGTRDGLSYIDIEAGPWHKVMGGYPARDGNHSMPIVCEAMWAEFSELHGDVVLYSPLKRKGASLKIRYRLPR
jgi:hypothetical protein